MKPDKNNFEQWNEELATKHDLEEFYNHPNFMFRYIERKRIRKLIELAEIEDNDLVLEVGCGAGHILDQITKGNLYGIDISNIQIERAKKKLGNKANILKAPGEKIPYPDKMFNKILCSEVIEHVIDPKEVLVEIHKKLKDDGILSLSIPNESVINFAKKILIKTHLISLVDKNHKTKGWELATIDNLEEWHLHSFSLKLADKYCEGLFRRKKTITVPNFLFPARYVIQYIKI